MEYKRILKSVLSNCKTEEEKQTIKDDFISLAKISGLSISEVMEYLDNVEEEMNGRTKDCRET